MCTGEKPVRPARPSAKRYVLMNYILHFCGCCFDAVCWIIAIDSVFYFNVADHLFGCFGELLYPTVYIITRSLFTFYCAPATVHTGHKTAQKLFPFRAIVCGSVWVRGASLDCECHWDFHCVAMGKWQTLLSINANYHILIRRNALYPLLLLSFLLFFLHSCLTLVLSKIGV